MEEGKRGMEKDRRGRGRGRVEREINRNDRAGKEITHDREGCERENGKGRERWKDRGIK
jgi:hypothetical protein